MSLLLSLPQELRDDIIEHVLSSFSAPPQSPEHDTCPREEATDARALRPAITPPHVLYHAYGLLLTNRQLNTETRSRLAKARTPYSLDVMVVGNELWPSWTCCPARAPGIEAIDVTLRFFAKEDDPFVVHVARTCRVVLRGRNPATASLHPLSEIFLYLMQVCLGRTDGRDGGEKIRRIRMDVRTLPQLEILASSVQRLSASAKRSLLFGKHRSLANQFASIQSYIGKETLGKWSLASTLKLMVLLMVEGAWADEHATYVGYVGATGAAFRRVQDVLFVVDGKTVETLAADPLLD
jgi:hypothetical protein